LTSDPERSRRFYTELFGWTAEEPNAAFGGYFNFRLRDVRVAGGMGKQPGMDAPDAWSVHLAAQDARATVDAAAARGAQVIVAPMDVADLGTMAGIVDPGGAYVGIWQPGSHPGSEILYEPGVPTWFELHTHAYDVALDFYRRVFGWTTQTMSDSPEFRYTIVVDGDDRLAGVMDDAAFGPDLTLARWLVYFGVEDADQAIARIEQLGGTVTRPAEDTPYGRLASISDPTGAAFNLMAPNAAMPFTRQSQQAGAAR
jgi:predicted enzyme related to lactoylglutathione lyase